MLYVNYLSKEFIMHIRNGKKIVSFKDISFELKKGEFLGLVGPSGIGKSSLLKCIYRSYIPTMGDIWYRTSHDEDINLAKADEHTILKLRRTDIGYISQFFHIIPRVPAKEVISGALRQRGFCMEESDYIAEEYLMRVGIPQDLWEMYPSTFSGGEKQRLNIIHAIVTRPRLLLLDEPTASLDANTKTQVIDLINELKEQGTSMIGVFHDRDTLTRLSDKELDMKLFCCQPAMH